MTPIDDLIKRLRDKVPPSGVLVVDMDTTRDLARLVVEAADALLRVRNEALEEAAKAVDVVFENDTSVYPEGPSRSAIATALLRLRNEAPEEAAKAVELMGSGSMTCDQESGWRAAEEAAIAAIRSLKDKEE